MKLDKIKQNILIKPMEVYYNFRIGVVERNLNEVALVIDDQISQTQQLFIDLFILPGKTIDGVSNYIRTRLFSDRN